MLCGSGIIISGEFDAQRNIITIIATHSSNVPRQMNGILFYIGKRFTPSTESQEDKEKLFLLNYESSGHGGKGHFL